ncbi:ABC transporter ATP-binding protein [Lentibacillus sediminis]|uniref:ABC transporter ATP-binding protein n=1 Tax=Lentibacillus sediminis TaxID=1940529 RepID=UPI000C1BB6A3|nr:ABC transporter ATP-binding protein [Lentibacillus sediminis]
MIEFNQATKIYPDGTEALKNFSLKVEKGEIVTLIGPSGCGKTTSLKMINRLIEPTSGTIYINDEPINDLKMHELRWNIGYVLQQIALFPHMTIEENVSVVPEMKKWKKNKVRERTEELLHMVGLEPDQYRKRMPGELSGGQQQRIGVIRALAADPDIILMDEPFSALDPISREQLQKDIQNLQKEIQKTIVFVTHDMDEALALGDKVCLMKDGEAVQIDTPQQLILHPKNSFVKDFIGERKSPWQTMVDIIADRTGTHVISKADYDEGNIPESGFYAVAGEEDTFAGTINNGNSVAAATLDNNPTLYKATEIIEASNQHVFPVVKGSKLIGTITYKDIVEFLRKNTKMENGVITHE